MLPRLSGSGHLRTAFTKSNVTRTIRSGLTADKDGAVAVPMLARGHDVARGLLIIDIQNDYFPGGAMPLVGPESAAEAASTLLEQFRRDGEPVTGVLAVL